MGLVFERWDVTGLAVETSRVLPLDPFDGGELGSMPGLLGSSSADQFGFAGSVECFGHGIVIRIAN